MACRSTTDPSLLDLPHELRQQILQLALIQKGSIELQHPVWAGQDTFAQPLFQVCQLLREEALQAFYEANCFLWTIDTTVQHRTDPSTYPSMSSQEWQITAIDGMGEHAALTSPLPWEYPHLKKHLRRLHVNIYLPSNLIGDTAAAQAWRSDLPNSLNRLVEALDYGRTLRELGILFTAKRFNNGIALAGEQLKALEVLAKMEVRGTVKVQMRWDFKEVKGSIDILDLERTMKAKPEQR